MICSKIVSSMEKCFLDGDISSLSEVDRVSTLRNEQISLQLAYTCTEVVDHHEHLLSVRLTGDLAPFVRLRRVESVPVTLPCYLDRYDEEYLRTTPGLYPDLLLPLTYGGKVNVSSRQLRTIWIDLLPGEGFPVGDHRLTLSLLKGEEVVSEQHVTLHVIDAELPENQLFVTQWFHCDCLAQYYGVETFSEKHWEIIERFAQTAVKNGINTLLTPVFTPPLDTFVGGERPTTQLVGVKVEQGKYTFDFSLLERWIEMCNRTGIKYFEIAHFFTQWGAAHAPKVVATVDGVEKKIFGLETKADGEEYTFFLHRFLEEFLRFMKARGDDHRCFFHVSDEPSLEHLDQYQRSKQVIREILADYVIIDALSNFDFYEQGVVDCPIPATDHIEPFLRAKIPNRWTYYCCSQSRQVSNRFVAMPGAKTRCIGMQFFKYDIAGFLQWGYNYYNNRHSHDMINPYQDTCADYAFPAGDSFSVYPAPDGSAYESMRLLHFREALEDCAAMRLAAELAGKQKVIEAMEELVGEIRFDRCLTKSEELLSLRERVNCIIEEKIKSKNS